MIELLCYLAAVILFGLAAANVPARVNMVALGLLFAFLPLLIDAFEAVS
jgi:putative Ca2+/H+ antiporter (TMEM165/GDT1 family)